MDHRLLQQVTFWTALLSLDQELAAKARQAGCSCGGVLHRADFLRKPRGGPPDLPAEYCYRFSFCCNREGCRKRVTPPSVRFQFAASNIERWYYAARGAKANADGQRLLFPLDTAGTSSGDGPDVAPPAGDQQQPAAELPPLLKKCFNRPGHARRARRKRGSEDDEAT